MDKKIKLTNCIKTIKILDKIHIESHLINDDFKDNVLSILKTKYENKCNKEGYVLKIVDVIINNDNIIDMEENNCSIISNVEVILNICIPMINDNVVFKIYKIDNPLKVAINGPLMCILKDNEDYINKQKFILQNNKLYNINKELININDYIVITIKQLKVQSQNDKIILFGYLNDIITESEARNYMINYNIKNKKNDKLFELVSNE